MDNPGPVDNSVTLLREEGRLTKKGAALERAAPHGTRTRLTARLVLFRQGLCRGLVAWVAHQVMSVNLDVVSLGGAAIADQGAGEGSEGKEVFGFALVATMQAAAAAQP